MTRTLMIVLPCALALGSSLAAGGGMELGTNFWNLGWHNPADCFQNVKEVHGENPWNPQFLKEVSIYRVFRFMDWDNTNNSTRQKWTERNPKDAAKQNPAAYEWMIDLCNRMEGDMWVTLPHLTVNRSSGDEPCDYALRLCILVKTGVDMKEVDLKPLMGKLAKMREADFVAAGGTRTCEPLKGNLKLYIEYSNETWNGMFRQSHYCCEEGVPLGLDPKKNEWTAGFRFHAWAALRLFRAADLVFGERSPRVVRVLATHSANAWVAGQHLQVVNDPALNPWKIKPDAIATAPYFGHSVDGAAADAARQLREAIRKSAADSEKHKRIADDAGMKLIAYEGGQHVLKSPGTINHDPVMHELYGEYLQEMSRFYSVFCHYAHVGRWGKSGAWGSIEQTGGSINEAHKYRALAEWAKGRGGDRR